MFSIILIAVWASVNAATWDDTPLQQHFDRIESVGFNNLAMGKQRNELEPRGGKFRRINETYIFPIYTHNKSNNKEV